MPTFHRSVQRHRFQKDSYKINSFIEGSYNYQKELRDRLWNLERVKQELIVDVVTLLGKSTSVAHARALLELYRKGDIDVPITMEEF